MVMEVREQIPVLGEFLLQPDALLYRKVIEDLRGPLPVNLAHRTRIPMITDPAMSRACRKCSKAREGQVPLRANSEGHVIIRLRKRGHLSRSSNPRWRASAGAVFAASTRGTGQ
jgi:hypothetical protein